MEKKTGTGADKDLKERYKIPLAEVGGVFLEGVMADVSCWPTIKAGTPEYWSFDDSYNNVVTQDGNDIVIL
jgi:hypothetical protein